MRARFLSFGGIGAVMLTSDEKRAAVRRIMKERGLTQAGWAQAAGMRESTLRAFVKGSTRNLRSDTEQKLAEAAGFHSADQMYGLDYGPPPARFRVWVKGYLGAGNAIQLFEAMGENEGFYEVSRPLGVSPDVELFAMEIRGGSMPPFRDGDVIYCEKRDHVDLGAVLGEPCAVETMQGEMLFKEVRRGYEPDTYNLLSWDGSPPRENVRIRRAMPFVSVVRKGRSGL